MRERERGKREVERERETQACFGLVQDFWFDNLNLPFISALTVYSLQRSDILDSDWSVAAFCSKIFLNNESQTVYLTVAPETSNSVPVLCFSYHSTDNVWPANTVRVYFVMMTH